MARSRRRRPSEHAQGSFDRLVAGWKRTETRRGKAWTVQPVSGTQAVKTYICPGCTGRIDEGTAHVVVWRADGVLGDTADLAARRHWHSYCWRMH